jgi:GNAT superfamily N-acetyltransferase
MYANREGGGAHIASASFMVDPAHHGRGAGRALGEHALNWARAHGFHGMQFKSNTRAVGLWKSLGFEIIGRSWRASATPPRLCRPPRDVPAAVMRRTAANARRTDED